MLPGYTASGTIEPSRFVDISGAYTVAQVSGAGAKAIGISHEGSCNAPVEGALTAAATVGLPIRVYGDTETCLLELGGTVAAGAMIKSDASGKGVAAVSTNAFYAIAQRGGVSGEKIPVIVKFGIMP